MGAEIVLPGEPPVTVTLRRSRRARRLSLRVSSLDGRVTLSTPVGVPEAEARAFALEKERWIRRHLGDRSAPCPVRVGVRLPVAGDTVEIRAGAVREVRAEDGVLWVPDAKVSRARALVGAYLKVRARDALAEASDRHAGALGIGYTRLALRDTRSRWGSCSADGRLMYSWRLIMAPPEVLDYVAAHEVAHLKEMNHSPAYWSVVGRLMPGYEAPRRWLRENGAALHRWRFAD